MYITKYKEMVVTGKRNNMDGLLDIIIPVNSDTIKNIIGHVYQVPSLQQCPISSDKRSASNISSFLYFLFIYTCVGTGFPGRVAFANFRTRSIIKCDTSTVTHDTLVKDQD